MDKMVRRWTVTNRCFLQRNRHVIKQTGTPFNIGKKARATVIHDCPVGRDAVQEIK